MNINELITWRNFMLSIFVWIVAWESWRAGVHHFKFGRKHYGLICFVLLIAVTIFIFSSNTISWKHL